MHDLAAIERNPPPIIDDPTPGHPPRSPTHGESGAADAPHDRIDAMLRFGWIGASAIAAERQGLAVRDAMLAQGVDPGMSDGIHDDTGIDPAAFLLMCGIIINGVDDEMHGMARSRMARGTAATICHATHATRTLEDAIALLGRFFRLMGSYCRVELDRCATTAVVRIHSDAADEQLGAIAEEMLAHFLHLQLSWLARTFLPLTRFTTRSPRHPAMGGVHPYLRCPVVGGSVTQVQFPAQLLGTACAGSVEDMPLWDAERFWLTHHPAISAAPAERFVAGSIGGAVFQLLQRADISLEDCCDELALSVSRLRRGLSNEGLTFREVRREAMIARAGAFLAKGLSADDAAFEMGYSDSRSFRRALRLAGGGPIRMLRAVRPPQRSVLNPEVMRALRVQCLRMQ